MPLVPVNGVSLNVQVMGQGPGVVALHGFTGSHHTWDDFVSAVGDRFTIAAVDLLGHGASGIPVDPSRYSIEEQAKGLASVLDHLGWKEAIWLGYSMGGRIALYLALTYPERCWALVLEGASAGIEDEAERCSRLERDAEMADMIEKEEIEAFVDYWESQPLFASQKRLPPEVRERLRCQRLGNDTRGLANSLRGAGTGAQPALYNRIPSLVMPVLFIAGEEDVKYRDLAFRMGTSALRGRVSIIPGSGHCPHLEKPDLFSEVVLAFLESIKVKAGPAKSLTRRSVP